MANTELNQELEKLASTIDEVVEELEAQEPQNLNKTASENSSSLGTLTNRPDAGENPLLNFIMS